jgi:lysozyme family protein
MDIFEQAFAIVVGNEEGFTTNSNDPGNWTGGRVGAGLLRGTKFGVSASAYPGLDIASLNLSDARMIYRRDFWDRMVADRLPTRLSVVVFDAAVNCGLSRAAKWLQQAVGTLPDGIIGDATLQAVSVAQARGGEPAICAEFDALRLVFMASLPTWRSFGHGWARRICRLPYETLAIAAQGEAI